MNQKNKYDSEADTLTHINKVASYLLMVAEEFAHRSQRHDKSKLQSPEKEAFDEYTPKLAACTYGSDEYKQFLKELKPALDHHYANNSHHPEHYPNGVNDMNLFDLVEMFFDWKAATERHNDGDILKSIDINEKRFGIAPQISQIFRNTLTTLNSEQKDKRSVATEAAQGTKADNQKNISILSEVVEKDNELRRHVYNQLPNPDQQKLNDLRERLKDEKLKTDIEAFEREMELQEAKERIDRIKEIVNDPQTYGDSLPNKYGKIKVIANEIHNNRQ